MHTYSAKKSQLYSAVGGIRAAPLKRHGNRLKTCQSGNADICGIMVGTRVVVGNNVRVKGAESVMRIKKLHHKIYHEQ